VCQVYYNNSYTFLMTTKYTTPAGFEEKAPIQDKDLINTKEQNIQKVKAEQQEALENPQPAGEE